MEIGTQARIRRWCDSCIQVREPCRLDLHVRYHFAIGCVLQGGSNWRLGGFYLRVANIRAPYIHIYTVAALLRVIKLRLEEMSARAHSQ